MDSLFNLDLVYSNVSELQHSDLQLHHLYVQYTNYKNSLEAAKEKLNTNIESPHHYVAINAIKNMSKTLFLLQRKFQRLISKHHKQIEALDIQIEKHKQTVKPKRKTKHPLLFPYTTPFQNFYFQSDTPHEKDNVDIVSIKESGYQFYHSKLTLKRWAKGDKNRLYESVRKSIVNEQSENFLVKLYEVYKTIEKTTNQRKLKQLQKVCEKLTTRMKCLKNIELADLVKKYRVTDWSHVAQIFDKFSENECKIIWDLVANPLINNGPWLPEEELLLNGLVERLGAENWEKINKKLDSQRTAFLCFVHYQSIKKRERKLPKKWTESENVMVKAHLDKNNNSYAKLIKEFGVNERQWKMHATYLKCSKDAKKGRYNRREKFLIKLYTEKGYSSSTIAKMLGKRTERQIMDFRRYVEFRKKVGKWTQAEVKELLKAVKYNGVGHWTVISQYVSGRSPEQCRIKYSQIKLKRKDLIQKYVNKMPALREAKKLLRGRKTYDLMKKTKYSEDDKIEQYFLRQVDNINCNKVNEECLAQSALSLLQFLNFDTDPDNQHIKEIGKWLLNYSNSNTDVDLEFDQLFQNLGPKVKNIKCSKDSKFSKLLYKDWNVLPPNKCSMYGLHRFRKNYEDACHSKNVDLEAVWDNINSKCQSKEFMEAKMLWYGILKAIFYWPLKLNTIPLQELQ